jgi:hypothetical protein
MADKEQLEILEQGVDAWNRWRQENPSARVDLSHANLAKKHLKDINLSHAHLAHTDFSHTNMEKANLAFAHLEGATFLFTNLRKADLRAAYLKRASLEDAVLDRANLSQAHLEGAMLAHASCRHASFVDANFAGVNFTSCDLESSNVASAAYDHKIGAMLLRRFRIRPRDLWRRRWDFVLDTTVRCRGVNPNSYGSPKFRRFLEHQDYLEELMESGGGRAVSFVWWLTSDCGRSPLRWALWCFLIISFFATAFWLAGPEHFNETSLPFSFFITFYGSVVTFTTLGYGDFVPCSYLACTLIMIEVLLGYFMLGGLISIFATRVVSRGR